MITPLALIGLVSLPLIVAFYMLRLRRRDVPVGSTFLWQQLVRDVEANAPWQRLRFSWLLLVQLLIAALVVAAAVRPFTASESDLAANVVLIVDTSTSMAARDGEGDRMSEARDRARAVVERLPEGGRVTVVAAADTASILVSESTDRAAASEAIGAIEASQAPGDLTDAFALASALAARDSDSTVVVVTDASGDRLPAAGIGAPVLVEHVGETDGNQAIAALSALRRAGGAQLDVFVAVANHSASEAARRLEIYADGALVDARELVIPPDQRSEALIGTVPPATSVIEARLAGADALDVDDRAFALAPDEETTRALVVGPGNAFLESALALLPRLELFAVGLDGYEDALTEGDEDGTPYGLVVFDRVLPSSPPELPALYVDPAEDGPYGTIEGRIEAPALDRADPAEPLLRFVDLTTVHIGRARDLEPADGLRAIFRTAAGTPLIGAGGEGGRRLAYIGFDLGESDLPLQTAFPLLMSNLVEYLLPPGDGVLPSSMRLGQAATAVIDERIERVTVTTDAPNETPAREVPVRDGRLTLSGADIVGIQTITAVSDDPELDGQLLARTAVNLFSADESDIAPGDPQRLIDMGRVPAADDGAAQPARAEWWWPLALAALVLLALEWLLFHRPTRGRLVRVFRGRPQPLAGRSR
jgi:hypothetical protein